MNINFEQMPNSIFDWAEKFSFIELGDSQKKEVLLYMSEEDYSGMYDAAKSLRSLMLSVGTENTVSKKSELVNHFELFHTSKKQVKFRALVAWQAAAIVLMILSSWLFYRVFDLQKAETNLQVAGTDTVYIKKEESTQPKYIHDTVYLYKQSENSSTQNSSGLKSHPSANESELNPLDTEPLREDETYSPSLKGNSMKDDSLLKKFGFVAI